MAGYTSSSSGARSSLAASLLSVNLLLYAVAAAVAAWALNYGIDETASVADGVERPARLFPMYYPIGNMATGFFVVFSILAALAGVSASVSGLHDVRQWRPSSLMSASASSLAAWGLTALAAGLACKEISLDGWRTRCLMALEGLMIILTGTQLLCTAAIHAGIGGAAAAAASTASAIFTGGRA